MQAAPQPTAAPTSAPAEDEGEGSDLPADQGCYLFENRLGPELTVTITAQQWKWNETFKVAADGGQHLICLSPGHFTVTVDAPPPWGTLNDDLYVEAGEHYRFPIVAG
jgi:serine protease Do